MRKLNLNETEINIDKMIADGKLYSYYGLTENKDVDIYQEEYATEHYRFSCEGNEGNKDVKAKQLISILNKMQIEYLRAMNISNRLFKITTVESKMTPYNTVVIDITVETVVGAFNTIVNCAGPDVHQFHASEIWVRANKTAEVWKSLYDTSDDTRSENSTGFDWLDEDTVDTWLTKVYDARRVVKDCIKMVGEPTDEQKHVLTMIMQR